VQGAFEPFFRANLDTAIINIGHESLSPYKTGVVVPADYVMDAASATALREYVSAWRHSSYDSILSQSR
jgi:beta-galactosidase